MEKAMLRKIEQSGKTFLAVPGFPSRFGASCEGCYAFTSKTHGLCTALTNQLWCGEYADDRHLIFILDTPEEIAKYTARRMCGDDPKESK
jgi:hypothetical protein